ncbi:MAG TPA: DUF86 domain-containing protein [Chthoniobacteraceae bacterium]|jgi:uncharacterized protein with HEPN domain|nr:DUF86 domain-containing protein [Chthoniobacteraceae bacterium]
MKSDRAYVSDILAYARRLQGHVEGATYEQFSTEAWMQDAAFRCLEVIGEIVKRLTPAFRAKHPTIPWPRIAGFRDVLAHGYDILDHELCWKVIQENVPELIAELEKVEQGSG